MKFKKLWGFPWLCLYYLIFTLLSSCKTLGAAGATTQLWTVEAKLYTGFDLAGVPFQSSAEFSPVIIQKAEPIRNFNLVIYHAASYQAALGLRQRLLMNGLVQSARICSIVP